MSSGFDARPYEAHGAPFRVPKVLCGVAVLPLVAGVSGVVAPASALMLGGALAFGAAVQTILEMTVAHRSRDRADRALRAGRSLPPELAWRERELTSAEERETLARSLRSLVHSLGRDVVMTAQVVNRPVARAQRARLLALADRLELVERPVAARGVLLVRELLRDGGSPLYDRTRAEELPAALDKALRALEARR